MMKTNDNDQICYKTLPFAIGNATRSLLCGGKASCDDNIKEYVFLEYFDTSKHAAVVLTSDTHTNRKEMMQKKMSNVKPPVTNTEKRTSLTPKTAKAISMFNIVAGNIPPGKFLHVGSSPRSRECDPYRNDIKWVQNMAPRGDKWLSQVRSSTAKLSPRSRHLVYDMSHHQYDRNSSSKVEATSTPSCSTNNYEQEIECDLERTYQELPLFQNEDTLLNLGQILKRIAAIYPEVGYVQGMNYIAAHIYMHMQQDVTKTLELFCWMMEDPKYDYCGIFSKDFPRVYSYLAILRDVIMQKLPLLFDRLQASDADSLHFVFSWVLTLYSHSMPFEYLAEIWDRFFLEGWEVFFKVAIVTMTSLQDQLSQNKDLNESARIIRHAVKFPQQNFIRQIDDLVLDNDIRSRIVNP